MIRSHHFSGILSATDTVTHSTTADLLDLLKAAVAEAGFNPVAEAAATFQPQGASAVLILEESHVAVHVWTECRKVTVDVHICDYHQNNLPKAETLVALLTIALSGTGDQAQWSYLSTTG